MKLTLFPLVVLFASMCLLDAAFDQDKVNMKAGSKVEKVAENLRGTWRPRDRVFGWGSDKHAAALRIRDGDRAMPARMRPSWIAWRKTNGARRLYRNSSDEELHARVFEESEAMVAENNIAYASGLASYELAINEFADYTEEEIAQLVNQKVATELYSNVNDKSRVYGIHSRVKRSIPSSVDWRLAGKVGPVKNQVSCGSDYAFSAVGAIESQIAIKYNVSVSLSEQQIVDCAGWGCAGADNEVLPWNVFEYLKNQTVRLVKGTQRRYTGKVNSCNISLPGVAQSKLAGYVMLPQGDEKALRDAVANIGPVSVAMNFGNQAITLYKSGVYNNYVGCGNNPTHPVLIVGYGTENGLDYFIIRNSWGETWGDKGYIKFRRGVNICGIADWASYPILA